MHSFALLLLAPTLLLTVPLAAPRSAPVARWTPPDELPRVVPNDNREPAGRLADGVLTLDLVALMARWAPEADDGPTAVVAALAEEGGPPRIPAPTIRVPAGTLLLVTVRNDLPDSTLHVSGLAERPADGPDGTDAVAVPPGSARTFRFRAGEPGTYLYRARPGVFDPALHEHDQLVGALVVDAPGAPTDDRVFVINIWGDKTDSLAERQALAINGRSWPHTERLRATVGDTLRWRVVNGSHRPHPMHLHGFYFTVEARGDARRDTAYATDRLRTMVTENLPPGTTMRLRWVADRPGNWLFHCHLAFHVVPEARLDAPADDHAGHSADAGRHMAGLVLGIEVRRPPGWREAARGTPRRLHLFVQEGAPRGLAPRALGYVLQRGAEPPAPDSVEIPGPVLVLTRGEAADMVVHNRLREPTAVHWHGIELESWSDGVAGWSGEADRVAPAIAPGDSFTARLTLPRAGTFIYHTHLNDLEQLTSGLYGAVVVLEPGRSFDPATDHVFVGGWDGEAEPPAILVNGRPDHPPLELAAGVAHRLRFVNIGPAGVLQFELRRDTALASWRLLALDGADLASDRAAAVPALGRLAVGQTFDAELGAPEPGDYRLLVRHLRVPPGGGPPIVRLVHDRGLRVVETAAGAGAPRRAPAARP